MRCLHILLKQKFLFNFSIFANFYIILNYFKPFIEYHYKFFFNQREFLLNLYKFNGFTFMLIGLVTLSELVIDLSELVLICYFQKLINSVFFRSVHNYYSSDLFSKNSKILSLCASKIWLHSFD
jgi:hypothetical protein